MKHDQRSSNQFNQSISFKTTDLKIDFGKGHFKNGKLIKTVDVSIRITADISHICLWRESLVESGLDRQYRGQRYKDDKPAPNRIVRLAQFFAFFISRLLGV